MRALLISTALCLGLSSQAHAQWTLEGMRAGTQDGQPKETQNKTSGLIDSINAVGLSGFGLNITENDKIVTAKIANEVVSDFNDDRTAASSRSWDFSVSAPLEDNDVAELATLERISSGTKASVKFTFGRTSDITFDGKPFSAVDFVTTDEGFIDQAQENCLEEHKADPEREEKCKPPFDAEGDELDIFKERYGPCIAFETCQMDSKSIWFTVSADLGFDDYEFLNATDLSSQTEQEIAYKAGVSFSYTETKMPFLFSIGANFESAFDQADEMENCIGEGDMENCVTGRLGAPERTDDLLAFTEVRHIANVNLGDVGQIGLAPRLSYNFSKGVTGVNMPVYFVKPEGGLSSGFQLGWRSDTKNITAGVILGGTFDFISG